MWPGGRVVTNMSLAWLWELWTKAGINTLVVRTLPSLVPRPRGRRETAWYRLLAHARSFPEKPGIRLHFEIVGKINTYTSVIFLCHRNFASWITFNFKNVEDNRRVYKGKDAFLWLPTSFGNSVRYEVLSFACLTVSKARYLQGGGSYAVILLVSPLRSLTISRFNGASVHCI